VETPIVIVRDAANRTGARALDLSWEVDRYPNRATRRLTVRQFFEVGGFVLAAVALAFGVVVFAAYFQLSQI
jgi:hypothetical protein